MEYKRYTDRPTKNRSSYSRIFKLNTHTTIKDMDTSTPTLRDSTRETAIYVYATNHKHHSIYF
ncbi:hypothetical protein PTT_00046 [Pyrenophora teres f. teres 0-1]|uniref:Uncharacterized protein n=1 Tax=Pyrenophora teres f. teres (strain 0-1) TaxID=861557 RepID=E3RCA3_PYRTT|nr:hypothetical protein PTT_00046 [Pyrenophora teres f. teres 0-1]